MPTTAIHPYAVQASLAPPCPLQAATAVRAQVLNSVRYAHRVLGVRPNVTVLDQNYMQFEWFVARAKRQPYFAGLTFPGTGYGTRHGDG